MHPTEPLPLHHSWPLFALGEQLAAAVPGGMGLLDEVDEDMLAARGIGLWHCDLSDNRLRWSAGVYDLFGLPRGVAVDRARSVAIYGVQSRDAMSRLRAYAIRHRRGFTLDVDLDPADVRHRRMRLIALPVLEQGRVVALRGVKQDITGWFKGLRDPALV